MDSSLPQNRDTVANLAAQILSAQIIGTSQYETLSNVWGEFRRSMVDIAETFELGRATGENPKRTAIRLRKKLQSLRSRIPKPDVLSPVGTADLEGLFQ